MFWPRLKVFWLSKGNFAGRSERKMKKRWTEEGGKTTLRSGQDCTLLAQLGQLKTRQLRKELL